MEKPIDRTKLPPNYRDLATTARVVLEQLEPYLTTAEAVEVNRVKELLKKYTWERN